MPGGRLCRVVLAAIAAVVLFFGAAPPPASAQGDNSCEYAFDSDCDEPGVGTGLCAAGTDSADCANPNPG